MFEYVKKSLELLHNEKFKKDIKSFRSKWKKELKKQFPNLNPPPPVNFKEINNYLYSDEILGFENIDNQLSFENTKIKNNMFYSKDKNIEKCENGIKMKSLIAGYKDNNDNNIYVDSTTSNKELWENFKLLLDKWQFDFINSQNDLLALDFMAISNSMYYFINACCVFEIDTIIDPRNFFISDKFSILEKQEIKSIKKDLKKLKIIETMIDDPNVDKEDIKDKIKNSSVKVSEPNAPIFLYYGKLPIKDQWIRIYDSLKDQYKIEGTNKTIESLLKDRKIYVLRKSTQKTYKEIAKEILKEEMEEKRITEKDIIGKENSIKKRIEYYRENFIADNN
ncbi:hypothetical protein JCM16358_11580 [Halanaerocella petrolearia]